MSSFVIIQIPLCVKPLLTVPTFERSLTCVRSFVHCQVAFIRETFDAILKGA